MSGLWFFRGSGPGGFWGTSSFDQSHIGHVEIHTYQRIQVMGCIFLGTRSRPIFLGESLVLLRTLRSKCWGASSKSRPEA